MSSIEILIEAETDYIQQLIVQRMRQIIDVISQDINRLPYVEITNVFGDMLYKLDPDEAPDLTE